MMSYLHVCTRASIRRARLILTVSRHAALEIGRHAGIELDRIIAIHHAPTPDLQTKIDRARLDEVRTRFGLEGSFILADALKNPCVLVRAWRTLPGELRTNRQTLFFALHSGVFPIVHDAVNQGDARLSVNPERADLIALYHLADLFVFPSWIEGFGFPLLEAITCGTPVIASNRGAIPEVVGDDGLLANPGLAEQLRRRGLARSAEFSWAKSVEQISRCHSRAW